MFDFAWSEFGLIALVAVLILGPKELPQAMRTMAKVVRKVRGMASEFQGHFNDMIREAELDDVRKSVQKLSSTNISAEVNKMIDPTGEINSALKDDPFKEQPDVTDAGVPADSPEPSPEPSPERLNEQSSEAAPAAEPEQSSDTPRGQTT